MNEWVTKKSWEEFRETGLLWFTNSILHAFGWAITMDVDEENNVLNVCPARVKFRGFDIETTSRGHKKIANYMKNNAEELVKEANM